MNYGFIINNLLRSVSVHCQIILRNVVDSQQFYIVFFKAGYFIFTEKKRMVGKFLFDYSC